MEMKLCIRLSFKPNLEYERELPMITTYTWEWKAWPVVNKTYGFII